MLSNKIDERNWNRIGVSSDLHLKEVPNDTRKFLDYHSEYVYDLMES